MAFRALTLLTLLMLTLLSGCGTDTKTTENLGASTGQSHYGGVYIDGNDNPANRSQYLGYSLKGTVNIGGTGNGTSPAPAYTTVDYTISCLSCHPNGDPNANAGILRDYATTGHADVTAIPWTVPEVGGTCQRCHTTFGFLYHLENYGPVNYDPDTPYRGITLSSPDYSPQWTGPILSTPLNQREEYRKAMQVLICSACHPENGLVTGTLRVPVTPGGFVAIWSANSITAQVNFPDAGASNLCIRCHSARRAGPNITELATTTAHYLPAAATVFSGTVDLINITDNTTTIVGTGTTAAPEFPAPAVPPFANTKFTGIGYEFVGQSYSIEPPHQNVGSAGGKGPCVGCHMGGAVGHSLKILSKGTAGKIASVNNEACLGCHGVITPDWLNLKKDGFQAGIAALDAQLQSQGFFLNPENGTFYKDAAFSVPLGANTSAIQAYYDNQANVFFLDAAALRGAAFNLWLYRYHGGDPASYAHNRRYTKKILFDTLDYLADGDFDGDIALADPVAADYLDGNSTVAGIQRP